MPKVPHKIQPAGYAHLLTVSVAEEAGILNARQRAKQLAGIMGFDRQDQIRIATATSEIARNAVQYGKDGRVEFFADLNADPARLVVRVSDKGPGFDRHEAILDGRYQSQTGMGLGLSGTRRLMDHFTLESTPGRGTVVTFAKVLPASTKRLIPAQISSLTDQLAREQPSAQYEVRQQNQELLVALELIRKQETELEKRQADMGRIDQELEETNRGVVALYAELDESAEALRRANDVKTRFLSYMSHEFRTPLNAILALTGLLLRRVDGELTSEQERQIKFVRTASNELFEMVSDLLDIAKVEAGKIELRLGTVEVTKVFAALRGMMRPLIQSEHVGLIFEDPPHDLAIFSDEAKINQILRNLVSNALKFTERGEVRLSARCENGRLLLSVADTGIGIAQNHQESIFREFTQIENPVQRRVRGTGLGLPLSRKLAELLGGTLTVASTLGEGSTFQLTLPLSDRDSTGVAVLNKPAEVSVSVAHPAAFDQTSPGTILVIDDEEVARYLVHQLFRGTRYAVTEATGGVEGLERARFDQPSLILLDITMPDRSGFEVLEDLKSDPATQHIPVVLHTSSRLTEVDLARLGGRHAAVLSKQAADRSEALAAIRKILDEPYLFIS
jgi:signal transduction histidine kinase/ActR/RegA family two-component response regulator